MAAEPHPQKIAQATPAALAEYGHLLETFAVGEILKQASWSDAPITTGLFRTEAGDEVDLVLERDDGQVIAFEIKAGSRISGNDLRGLCQLKERLDCRPTRPGSSPRYGVARWQPATRQGARHAGQVP